MAESNFSHVDVILVGAGISGINFAYRLQEQLPHLSYVILEGRERLGGTWDLFKYPGLRSDSDLHTFGFLWRAWNKRQAIAEAPLIMEYLHESASAFGIDKHMLFEHSVETANWSSADQEWMLNVTVGNKQTKQFRSSFLIFCTGYYDYKTPMETEIPGLTNFKGTVVHPQFWPEKLDYEGQNVVIIGSGATAVTLLPALAQQAARTTMLQRSPSYVLNTPNEDGIDHIINTVLPQSLAKSLIRIKYLVLPWMVINFCYYYPSLARRLLRFLTISQLPPTISHDPHFKPAYNPFEQRLCLCPDGDFFAALRSGKCDIVTGKIETMTSDTIKLTNGYELHPDIIVTATGLKVQVGGGMKVYVDGKLFDFGEKFMWKTSMIQDLPNAAYSLGYVNASWTLGADATAKLVCRVLKKMEREKSAVIVPRVDSTRKMQELPLMNLSSTYIRKAQALIPKASNHPQWNSRSTYFRDIWEARFGDITSDVEYIPFQTNH